MQPDLTGILMLAFLGGGILTFIGAIIKFFNAGDVLNFYNEKTYDKDKVSKVVGSDIFYTGLVIIIIAIISIFVSNKYYYVIMMSQVVIILLGILLSCYHFFFTCKK